MVKFEQREAIYQPFGILSTLNDEKIYALEDSFTPFFYSQLKRQ